MNHHKIFPILLALLLTWCGTVFAQKNANTHNITLNVTEKKSKNPIIMGTVILSPSGLGAVTDMNGKAVIRNVPEGRYTLTASYIGFETYTLQISVGKSDINLKVEMVETTLLLNNVSVTARQNVSGSSTSSIIGRQAIDHLQATSLADIMQLVPGQLMGNGDLTSPTNIQLR